MEEFYFYNLVRLALQHLEIYLIKERIHVLNNTLAYN